MRGLPSVATSAFCSLYLQSSVSTKSNLYNQINQTLEQADEEFNIEKGKIVRAETVNIEAFFQKKLKQSDIQRKMYESLVA